MGLITNFEEDVYRDWSMALSGKISESLEQHLIIRDQKEGTLKVHFGGDLRALLREVIKEELLESLSNLEGATQQKEKPI